jgi:predicted Holliday junction resolvase-like endonuclease
LVEYLKLGSKKLIMNIFRLIGELVVIYILYKVIFDFIIPLYKSTKKVRSAMSDMQAKMQEQQRAQAAQNSQASQYDSSKKSNSISKDDYIDYEEIKG